MPGWGLTSAATLLRRHGRLDAIPCDHLDWDVVVRGAPRLAASLREYRDEALLCRDLSELRTDLPIRHAVDDLCGRGAHRDRVERLCATLEDDAVVNRIARWSGQGPNA